LTGAPAPARRMKHFFTLLFHEIRMLLISPATYVAAVLFLMLMGLFYVMALQDAARVASDTLPSETFFSLFFLPVWFMVPLLTMRSIAEERRQGTLETLMSTPASALAVVTAKFLGAYLFYIFLWALTLGYPLVAAATLPGSAAQEHLLDFASLAGGYTFVALSGAFYVAIGIFTSSLTRTQLVAGMLCFCILFIITVSGRLILEYPLPEATLAFADKPLEYLQTFRHLEDFSRGVIDTRPFFLYLSGMAVLLGVTSLLIESKLKR